MNYHLLFWIPLILILGAFGRRSAGGLLNQWFGGSSQTPITGDTPTRLLYGLTISIAAFLGGAPWYFALAMIIAIWIGTTTGNFNAMGMGRLQTSFMHDFLGMTAHGFLSALAPCLLIGGYDYYSNNIYYNDIIMFGLVMTAPFLYNLGWLITGKSGISSSLPIGFNGSTLIAEALWGAMTALGAFLSFWMLS